MKNARLGDYIFWNGKLAHIIGETNERTVIIEMVEKNKCPHCKGDLDKNQFCMIPRSPLFQESAEAVPTIIEDRLLRKQKTNQWT